jgi:hypothetical protein
MYVTTFDSAPYHADRVERNGMQAWRSCNGETRDEMRWRIGRRESQRLQSHMHVSGATANADVLTCSRNYILATSNSGIHGQFKSDNSLSAFLSDGSRPEE